MHTSKLRSLQKKYGIFQYQQAIFDGTAWTQTPQFAQKCKELLERGACILPVKSYSIHFHSVIPSRYDVPKGTTGTLEFAEKFWSDDWNKCSLIGEKFEKYDIKKIYTNTEE